ncbi:MAG TPA: hypothetical protein VNT29_02360 [Candidatus Limnocylindrales bacterium]|nr:hypothetical protein [Candidatus Limnocylindrales bacterium]
MRRVRVALLVAVVFLLSASAFAQFQRVALPAQTIRIAPGKSAEVPGFCLDLGVPAPKSFTRYDHVLEGGGPVTVQVGNGPEQSLADALGKTVRFEVITRGIGMEDAPVLNVKITPLDRSQPITIHVKDTAALGPSAGYVTPVQLTAVKDGQYGMWKAAEYESLLVRLGYHEADAKPTLASLAQATRRIQQKKSLPVTGDLSDRATQAALRADRDAILNRFAAVGFKPNPRLAALSDPRGFTDIGPIIRGYREAVGLPGTENFNPAVERELGKDEAIVAALRRSPRGGMPSGVNLLASSGTGKTEVHLLGRTGRLEAWHLDVHDVFRVEGLPALASMETNALAAFADHDDALVVHALPYLKGDAGEILLEGDATDGDVSELLAGTKGVPELDEYFAAAKKREDLKRLRLVVHRPTISQLGVGAEALKHYFGEREVVVPDALKVAAALARRYGANADVMLANDPGKAAENLLHLPVVEGGSQIRVYVDKQRLPDFNTIAHIREKFGDAHIEVVKVGKSEPGAPRIVLFTGHNSADARALISELGTAGHFKDSIVALAICGEGGEVPFNTQLIKDSGARAVLFYDQRISQTAVEKTLLELCNIMSKEGTTGGNIQQLLRRAIAAVLKDTTLKETERAEIRRLREAVLQLSNVLTVASERAA